MLKKRDNAPDFETTTQSGQKFKLSDQKGKKIVLYWYVKDNTKGCQAESASFRDRYSEFQENGIEVFGIAPGSEKTHKNFKEKNNLPFPLLLDENHEIAEKYGVWQKKKMYGREYMGIQRTTFLIDEDGKIDDIFGPGGVAKVKTKEHADQIIEHWNLSL